MHLYFDWIAGALTGIELDDLAAIEQALWDTYQRDGTIFVCGNGGNAATASHFVCDLMKLTVEAAIAADESRMRALALTDNVPLLTAWANDEGYDRVFVEQFASLSRPGDMLVALSASGNSPNVLHTVLWANAQGRQTVGIAGFEGGRLAQTAQRALVIPSHSMQVIEDIQSIICHALASGLAERMGAL